jgi:outer membrane protein
MNKLKLFLIAAVLVFSSSAAMAQKSGYISIDMVLGIMPEAAKIDSLMQKFQADTLTQEYVGRVEQYKYYDSLLTKTDTTKMPVSLRRKYAEDRDNVAFEIQNWQTYAQNLYQSKQNQLLSPVYNRIMKAIRDVAKEKGYTNVYDKQIMIVGNDSDDLLPAVAQKLNVKVPPNVPVGLK